MSIKINVKEEVNEIKAMNDEFKQIIAEWKKSNEKYNESLNKLAKELERSKEICEEIKKQREIYELKKQKKESDKKWTFMKHLRNLIR
jgi:predicted RNase H-like nuclease (RuvC/YqgF family)